MSLRVGAGGCSDQIGDGLQTGTAMHLLLKHKGKGKMREDKSNKLKNL